MDNPNPFRRSNHKDHEIAQFVNNLTDIAQRYTGAQCLRDVLSREVLEFLHGPHPALVSLPEYSDEYF